MSDPTKGLALWILLWVLAVQAVCKGASIVPVDLRCESLIDPRGLDVARPRLAWRLEPTNDAARGQRQAAYQVRVDRGLDRIQCWDSGEVASDSSQHVEYAGEALTAGDACTWAVRVKDERGEWSDWSRPATWSMGPMSAADWFAIWIGSSDIRGRSLAREAGKPNAEHTLPDPWLRKTVELKERPTRAVLYVASVGYHELYVNGRKIGDAVLMPSATNHAKRARYVTYDVTGDLNAGRNVIGLWLGTGWSIFPAYQTPDKPAGPIVVAQLEAQMPGGEVVRVGTDASWKARASPNQLTGYWDAHGFAGERYDARQALDNWCDITLDDSTWPAAAEFAPKLEVSAEKLEPNRLQAEFRPAAMTQVGPGVWRVDMGMNYAGWFEAELVGDPGSEIRLAFSERPEQESSFGLGSVVIPGPSGRITWRNRFNYMAGRWVQISGTTQAPDLSKMRGWVVRTDYARAGGFECDDPQLNAVYAAANRTFESVTLGGMLVDCPHRERRGYGDGFGVTRMACDNYRLDAFYAKWAEDWRDVASPGGAVAHSAPTMVGGGGPAWSGSCTSLPWAIYKRFGDRRVLEAAWPQIKAWLAFLESNSKDDLLTRYGGRWSFLGDWQWPGFRDERAAVEKQKMFLGDTPEALFFNNCFWVYNLETAAKIAETLGNFAAVDAYRARAAAIRRAVHARFFDADAGSYVNGYPAYLAIALLADVPPPEARAAVWVRLEREILRTREGHIWAGIIGGGLLFETLLDARRDDLICAMVSKTDYPSWTDMLTDGGGTFHEDWDGRGTRLHNSMLYVGGWFIEGLGGIRQSDSGYKRLVIQPWITRGAGPEWVNAHYDSAYGRVAVRWKKRGDAVELRVQIPPGTQGVLRLPEISELREGATPMPTGDLTLVSGTYEFAGVLK